MRKFRYEFTLKNCSFAYLSTSQFYLMLKQDTIKQLTQQLGEAAKYQNTAIVQEIAQKLLPADLSTILDELNTSQCHFIIDVVPPTLAAAILADLAPEIRKPFLQNFIPEELAVIIDQMESDNAVDVLNEQDVLFAESVMPLLNKDKANDIRALLHYPPDCAGGLMSRELIKVNVNWTVKQCLAQIKQQAERVKKVFSVYVVDEEDNFLGRVALKTIIISDNDTKISEIYLTDVLCVETHQSQEEVAAIMRKYDLETLPVVNLEKKLLGRIMVDDILELIQRENELDIQAMSGLSANVSEGDSSIALVKARLPWLLIGMIGGLLGATFLGTFEHELSIIPAMAFFIPLITATGGNAGIQSSTIVVQSLAETHEFTTTWWERLTKALSVALLNGLAIALFVFLFNMLFLKNIHLAFIVSIALFTVVVLASILGTITPLILDYFGINPAVASGPFITTANDLVGLGIYFGVAKLLLDMI